MGQGKPCPGINKMEVKKTRNNIYPILHQSPFTAPIHYELMTVTYFFSSKQYLVKFIKRAIANREAINNSLSNRFKIKCSFNVLADIVLYTKIEKRGFYITTESEEFKCQNNLLLNGVKAIEQKSQECEKTLTQK